MCGIVGMAGNLNTKHNKMFRDMLVFDTVRGSDSTGVAFRGVGLNGEVQVVKTVGVIDGLYYTDKVGLVKTDFSFNRIGMMYLGHNRAATVGKIKEDTAHPFKFGDITGVHNGTLWYYKDLVGHSTHETDSQCLINTIAEKGIDATWRSFRGAAAVVYWDEREQEINLIRNSERPLYIGVSAEKNALFWASEPWMIRVAADRNDVKLEKITNDKGNEVSNIVLLREDHIHRYKVTAHDFTEVEVRKVEGPAPFVQRKVENTNNGGRDSWAGRGNPGLQTRRSHQQPKQKDYTKVNHLWAEGFDKAGKESRGIEFKLVAVGSSETNGELVEEWVTGQPVHYPAERIKIMTTSRANFLDLVQHINKDVTFRTTNRMRVKVRADGNKEWRISSACIARIKDEEPGPDTKVTVLYPRNNEPKQEVLPPPLHRIGNRGVGCSYVSEAEWTKHVQKVTGGTCVCCGDPVFSANSHEIYWLDQRNPVCNVCQYDPYIQAQFQFGQYSYAH